MDSKKIAIAGLFLLVLAVVFSKAYSPESGFLLAQKFFQTAGWTTLSLTKAVFTSASKFFTGKVWILTVAQGGLGQHAEGVISASEVKEQSGVQPENDLKIGIDFSKSQWEYPIKVDYTSTPVYHYELQSTTSWNPLFNLDEWSKKACPHRKWWGKIGGAPPTYWCIDEVQKTSYVGYLDSCNYHFTTTVKVEAKGESYEKTIDSKEQISTYIGPYVYVIWNGNLIKQSCPSPSPYVPYYSNGWKLGSKHYYDDYKAKYNYFIDSMRLVENRQISYDLETLQRMVDLVDQYGDRFLSHRPTFGQLNNPYDISRAYVSLQTSGDVQVPVYTFYVKADWLGIYQPTPKPQIIDARGTSFKSGESGYLYVSWKNVGDTGNFAVWATCQSPIDVMDTTKVYSVKKGETGTAYVRVGYNGYQHVETNCKIYVQAQGTSYVDSRTVRVTADPQTVCNPGEMICDGPRIKKCNPYGSGWDIVKVCAEDEYCTYVNGVPQCVKHGQPTPTPSPFDWLKKGITNILVVIAIIIVILIILLITGVIKK